MASVVRVAVPSPLRRSFEYLPPAGDSAAARLLPGMRVKVPFGGATRIGVVLATANQAEIEVDRLRRVAECLDEEPSIPPSLFRLLTWAADYYHHPIGEVFRTALPAGLRRARAAAAPRARAWRLTGAAAGGASLSRAPRQAAVIAALEEAILRGGEPCLDENGLASIPNWRPAVRALARRGWVEPVATALPSIRADSNLAAPNESQARAVEAIADAGGSFQSFLLDGVTGSGKTEVYLIAIDRFLRGGDGGGQALVLVPEIGSPRSSSHGSGRPCPFRSRSCTPGCRPLNGCEAGRRRAPG